MSNATIVAFDSGSKNARGVLFEEHIIINVVLQGKFFCLLFTPPPKYMAMLQDRQNAELHKHLISYNVAFAFTSTRIQSVGFELRLRVHTYKVQRGFYHLIGVMEPTEGQLPCFLQTYVHDTTNVEPQSKPDAFDHTLHNPWAHQSLCKHLHSCNRLSHRKPCSGGPHLHYKWLYPGKWRCPSLQRPYGKQGCNDNSWRVGRG
jgi:hypothetical protein